MYLINGNVGNSVNCERCGFDSLVLEKPLAAGISLCLIPKSAFLKRAKSAIDRRRFERKECCPNI
jgi:hypothetical protein